MKRLLSMYFIIVLILYYFPIASTIFLSFNAGTGLGFPIQGFSLKWYYAVLQSDIIISSVFRSLQLALVAMVITTLIVLMSALVLREYFRARDIIFYLFLLGMIVPGIVYGLGSALLYKFLNVTLSLWTALPIQAVYAIPFGLLLMLVRFDPDLAMYEQAARTLGASEWSVFREVTFPLIRTEVIAAALFGFTLSLGELQRTLFVLAGAPTLPVYIFSRITQLSLTPDFYALASLIIGISLMFIGALAKLITSSGRKNE